MPPRELQPVYGTKRAIQHQLNHYDIMQHSAQTLHLRIIELVLALLCLALAVAYCRLRQCIHEIWQMIRDDCFHALQILVSLFRYYANHQPELSRCQSQMSPMESPNGKNDRANVADSRVRLAPKKNSFLHRLKRLSLFVSWLSQQTAIGSIVSIRLDAELLGWDVQHAEKTLELPYGETGSASLFKHPLVLLSR